MLDWETVKNTYIAHQLIIAELLCANYVLSAYVSYLIELTQ